MACLFDSPWHNNYFFGVVKANKPHTAAQNSKDKLVNAVSVFSDAGLLLEEILNKTSALLLSEG